MTNTSLPEYSDDKRLSIYKILISACTHLYSKGKLQEEKFLEVAKIFADLSKNDPVFMAHLTSWAANKDSKDMKVLTTFFNSLNDADGTPFFKGSKKNKPNFRQISSIVLQSLDPHLALRVAELCHKKFGIEGLLNHSSHFSTSFKTAFKKYLLYRENYEDMLRGIKKNGMANKLKSIYRFCHLSPSNTAASILKWKQKDGRQIVMEKLPDFKTLSSQEIAEKLIETKISPVVAISIIPKEKVTTSVAKSLLQNCTGNQSIVLYNWFSSNGFLDVKSIKDLFKNKVKDSTTAIDRIDTLTKNADEEDKVEMSKIRSEKRKSISKTSRFGKIFLHIDKSSSMSSAIDFAKNKASIIAECIENPKKNFSWGLFGTNGRVLDVPNEFTKEDFHAALFGVRANDGATDCFALYDKARQFGAEIDIYVTDQGHNVGNFVDRCNEFHLNNPNIPKPRAVMIVSFGPGTSLKDYFERLQIPVVVVDPDSLSESALVAQSIGNALAGELAVIEEIMETKLPTLPKWWEKINSSLKERC